MLSVAPLTGLLAATSADSPMPTTAAWILGPVLTGAGLLVAWVGYQGWRGRLKRNLSAGIRTALTLSSDEAWDAAHRKAGPWILLASLGSIVPGVAVMFRPPNRIAPVIVMAGMAVLVGFVFVGGLLGTLAAQSVGDGPER